MVAANGHSGPGEAGVMRIHLDQIDASHKREPLHKPGVKMYREMIRARKKLPPLRVAARAALVHERCGQRRPRRRDSERRSRHRGK
jgi:hypothetical protein